MIYAVISIGSSVGNYRVVSKLGAGAMATVYLAEHPRINKKVAIKVINQELAASKEMVSRFMTEARAASQIGHDHIVDILDFGQSPEGENFMIMEYLEGQTISSRIRAAVRLDVMTALHITAQVVDALQTAHAKGVIHRDVKPIPVPSRNENETGWGKRCEKPAGRSSNCLWMSSSFSGRTNRSVLRFSSE